MSLPLPLPRSVSDTRRRLTARLGITIFKPEPEPELDRTIAAGGYRYGLGDRYGTIDRHEDAVVAAEQHALWRMRFEEANPPALLQL